MTSARPSAAPLRVCHLGKFYPPHWGGIETHVRLLAALQAERGADVRVVCVNHRVDGRTSYEPDGRVRVIRLRRSASIAKLDVCPELSQVLLELRRKPVDVVHLHVPNPLMLLALVVLPPPASLVVTYHSDVVHQKVLGAALRPFERLTLERADRIVTTSPMYAAGSPLLRAYAEKVRPVSLGIDLRLFESPGPAARTHAEDLRRAYGAPLWLCVGRLVPYKAHRVALDALRHVPGRLMIVGEGPLEAELRRHAVDIGVADRVVWRRAISISALVGCYHAATALWFPSNARSEAFGIAQVEGMASGCPVINCAIPHSGVPWVSQNEETGLTVKVDDPRALAEAALRLLRSPEWAARLGASARARAAREFGQERMASRTLALYREVVSDAGRVAA